DDARHVLDLVGEHHGGAVARFLGRDVRRLGPATFVAALGPPGLVIEPAELVDLLAVGDDQEPRDLAVGAGRRLDPGPPGPADVPHRDRVRPEFPRRTLSEDDFADRHRETIRAHALLPPVRLASTHLTLRAPPRERGNSPSRSPLPWRERMCGLPRPWREGR